MQFDKFTDKYVNININDYDLNVVNFKNYQFIQYEDEFTKLINVPDDALYYNNKLCKY